MYLKVSEGGDNVDPRSYENWEAAAVAGVPRGAHHFMYWCRAASEQAVWFQQLAGLLMWVVCGIIYMVVALWPMGAWLQHMETQNKRRGGSLACFGVPLAGPGAPPLSVLTGSERHLEAATGSCERTGPLEP